MRRWQKLAMVACLAVAGTGGALWVLQPNAAPPATIVETVVGGTRLRFDSAYRPPMAAAEGGSIDLVARYPGLRPAGGASVTADDIVVLNIRPQDSTVSPVERPVRLYARFLAPDVWSHPGGLMMRRFETGSPYDHEDLYLAPPEGRQFSARCMRPSSPPDAMPTSCLTELRREGLDIQVRYSPELLGDWQNLMATVREFITQIEH